MNGAGMCKIVSREEEELEEEGEHGQRSEVESGVGRSLPPRALFF